MVAGLKQGARLMCEMRRVNTILMHPFKARIVVAMALPPFELNAIYFDTRCD